MACDAGLINQVGTTLFDHFVDRISFMDIKADTMYGRSVLLLGGDEWRTMRSTLSPAFTGSKIRNMFGLVSETAHNFAKSLLIESKRVGSVRREVVELFTCYSADVMSSCIMGLEINSVENPSNGFLVHGKAAANFSGIKTGARILLLGLFPRLMQAIDFEYVTQCVRKFFKLSVMDTMNERTERQIFRPDLINTLMDMRNERSKYEENRMNGTNGNGDCCWTDDDLVAQSFVCFVLGFDTSGNASSFMAYELALNQSIQQRLYEEIRTVNEELDGGLLTYDALPKLKYLDQVIDETLRKWPPAPLTTRKCTKDIDVELGDGRKVLIERGTNIWISLSSIHNDPRYFRDPMRFDPERFSEENKKKIETGSYIPFGVGPRRCIGEYTFVSARRFLLVFHQSALKSSVEVEGSVGIRFVKLSSAESQHQIGAAADFI